MYAYHVVTERPMHVGQQIIIVVDIVKEINANI